MKCAGCGTSNPVHELRPYPPVNDKAYCLNCLWEQQKLLVKGLKAADDLINNSKGVYGLLNHHEDPAPWHEMRVGGLSGSWLEDFDTAMQEVKARE